MRQPGEQWRSGGGVLAGASWVVGCRGAEQRRDIPSLKIGSCVFVSLLLFIQGNWVTRFRLPRQQLSKNKKEINRTLMSFLFLRSRCNKKGKLAPGYAQSCYESHVQNVNLGAEMSKNTSSGLVDVRFSCITLAFLWFRGKLRNVFSFVSLIQSCTSWSPRACLTACLSCHRCSTLAFFYFCGQHESGNYCMFFFLIQSYISLSHTVCLLDCPPGLVVSVLHICYGGLLESCNQYKYFFLIEPYIS